METEAKTTTLPLRINVISETTFTVRGHGVHTAFVEMCRGIKEYSNSDLRVNSFRAADITHIHTVGLYSVAQLLFGRGKKVVSAHVVPESFLGSLRGAKFWLPISRVYLRWFYRKADLTLAVSPATVVNVEKLSPKANVKILANTIDTKRYHSTAEQKQKARQDLNIPHDSFVVVSSGQVQPRKRVDSFIAAAKKLPDVQFIWVGGMPFGKVAESEAEMKAVVAGAPNNVTFTGVIELDLVMQYYWAANMFFLPSEQETFGLVVIEAAAAGLPIMLRDIPDYEGTFKDYALVIGEDGFADTIQKLRDDRTLCNKQHLLSGQLAKKYDSRVGTATLLSYYRELLRKPS